MFPSGQLPTDKCKFSIKILPNPGNTVSGAVVKPVGPELLDAFLRLLELTETPGPTMVLSNLVIREIYFRLLTSPFGAQLRNLNTLGSQSNQITQAIG